MNEIAPALPAISHERVVFSSGFGIEQSPFQGPPSEENNKLWAGLYDCKLRAENALLPDVMLRTGSFKVGISRISADEARPMDNKTLPIPGREGGYVVQLSVFHQLHCLVRLSRPTLFLHGQPKSNTERHSQNLIRKGLYGAVDMTNVDELLGIEHLDHCLDMLRQSVMVQSPHHFLSCLEQNM
ncbi:hypothetical protein QBC35DRAFT_396303 [Podospora australis]|uniref:Uncharacterized protein n=1 Tax=Podospora australis TaxID=1536484 RepID=A0AAN6WLD9_9PEZI|nr:hypothetical protein QBC35DRAFT_396303 [Podospora australis]